MPWSRSKAAPEQCHVTTCHKLARNHKQQTLELRFSRFEAKMRRAGWVARRRPLAGPLSPCGSQPAPSPGRNTGSLILRGRLIVFGRQERASLLQSSPSGSEE